MPILAPIWHNIAAVICATILDRAEEPPIATKHLCWNVLKNEFADVVILCTGYENQTPSFLSSIEQDIAIEDRHFVVLKDCE
mgnify:CR=1 FL=1